MKWNFPTLAAGLMVFLPGAVPPVGATQPGFQGGLNPAVEATHYCDHSGAYTLLGHEEYETLEVYARRVALMMREILPFDTQVWPHAVRDSQGRTGLVLESSVPVSMLADSTDQEFLKGWIVCAILAVGKYSEIPGVRVDHVCFTDGTGAAGGGWFYDADHVFIMELYRSLVGGQVGAGEAYAALVSNWSHVVPES
jgi:hypothetical protein